MHTQDKHYHPEFVGNSTESGVCELEQKQKEECARTVVSHGFAEVRHIFLSLFPIQS